MKGKRLVTFNELVDYIKENEIENYLFFTDEEYRNQDRVSTVTVEKGNILINRPIGENTRFVILEEVNKDTKLERVVVIDNKADMFGGSNISINNVMEYFNEKDCYAERIYALSGKELKLIYSREEE